MEEASSSRDEYDFCIHQRLKKIELATQSVTITLPITTRGVGMGITSFHQVYLGLRDERSQCPNVYSLFRVSLALVETKLQLIKRGSFLHRRHSGYELEYKYDYSIMERCKFGGTVPTVIKRIVNAIGAIEYGGIKYLPAMMNSTYTSKGKLIPRPENILFSNLRETVTTLADPDVPRRYREQFFHNNSIPGAIWDDDFLLQNADEIMPVHYDDDNLTDDLWEIDRYIYTVKKYAPHLLDTLNLTSESGGRLSLFVCNEQEDLAIRNKECKEDYLILDEFYTDSVITGNIDSYYCGIRLSKIDIIEGMANLLGESPKIDSDVDGPEGLIFPFYCCRDKSILPFSFGGCDYLGARSILYD